MNKKLKAIVLLQLLALSVPLCAEVKDTVLTFDRSLLQMETVNGLDGNRYLRMAYPGLSFNRKVGEPELPYLYFTLNIPSNASNVVLSTSIGTSHFVQIYDRIYPVQWQRLTSASSRTPGFAECNSAIYGCSDGFPNQIANVADISGFNDFEKYVRVALCPIRYYPADDKYEFFDKVAVSVAYETPVAKKSIVVHDGHCPSSLPLYEYCIITSRSLANSFNRMKGWIKQKGMDVGIVCVEDIVSDVAIKGDTVSGLYDDAGKIRQYLQYGYKYGGTRYVLFGGDDTIVPIRYGTGEYDPWDDDPSQHVPSDFYFAELNSNWNVDGDSLLGERHKNMDYKAELSVGRILCSNNQEVFNYTEKLLRYEVDPGRGDYSYLSKLFLSQSSGLQEMDEAHLVANEIVDLFPDTTIVSEVSGTPSYPNGRNLVDEMKKHYGYVTWLNHGLPPFFIASENRRDEESLNAVTSLDVFDTEGVVLETGNGLDCLDNRDYPMIAYSVACYLASFDKHKSNRYGDYLNFARSFTTGKGYGGPAMIGNSRVGYEAYSYLVQQCFNRYMRCHRIGESINLAKLYNTDDYGRHQHALTINVIGCPDLNIWTVVPMTQHVALTYESDGVTIRSLGCSDSVRISVCSLAKDEKPYVVSGYLGDGMKTIRGAENSMLTLIGRNCLPCFLPLKLQNANVSGENHLQTANVWVGSNVREGETGPVFFKLGSHTKIESSGNVVFTKDVTIEKGAQIAIKQTDIER